MILANATVDVIRPSTPKRIGLFSVKVWGKPPYDQTRIYEIQARNETAAAQQGIARFVKEMESAPVEEN